MPELPEIETVKRIIGPQIQGLAIESISVRRPEVIAHPAADEFCRRLRGQTFDATTRRGKFLVIRLESGDKVIIHLRMTGCLLVTPADYPEEKHTHIVFRMDNGKALRFSDTRRFGRLWLLQKEEADTYSGMEKLGREPLSPDFTAEYLASKLGKRKKAVKECLMEQGAIAGIGNIYSDEILFAAGIYPARPANSLTGEEWERLAERSSRSGCRSLSEKTKYLRKNIWKQRAGITATRHFYRFTVTRESRARHAKRRFAAWLSVGEAVHIALSVRAI